MTSAITFCSIMKSYCLTRLSPCYLITFMLLLRTYFIRQLLSTWHILPSMTCIASIEFNNDNAVFTKVQILFDPSKTKFFMLYQLIDRISWPDFFSVFGFLGGTWLNRSKLSHPVSKGILFALKSDFIEKLRRCGADELAPDNTVPRIGNLQGLSCRVMPTKNNRRSSSMSSSEPPILRSCGRMPSSRPMINTWSNSKPLAACIVIRDIRPDSAS